jgi:hypothetical protein
MLTFYDFFWLHLSQLPWLHLLSKFFNFLEFQFSNFHLCNILESHWLFIYDFKVHLSQIPQFHPRSNFITFFRYDFSLCYWFIPCPTFSAFSIKYQVPSFPISLCSFIVQHSHLFQLAQFYNLKNSLMSFTKNWPTI